MRVRAVPIVLFLALLLAPVVSAQSVHFLPGSPVFTDQGVTLNAAGRLAGLGNGDVLVTLTATADVSATCTNKGGNQAPGQNPADVTVSGTQAIPASEVQNGNVSISVTTLAPPAPTAEAAGCPNGNWSAEIVDLDFQTATITVTQSGVVVLTQTYAL
jgi:hypothetical protein